MYGRTFARSMLTSSDENLCGKNGHARAREDHLEWDHLLTILILSRLFSFARLRRNLPRARAQFARQEPLAPDDAVLRNDAVDEAVHSARAVLIRNGAQVRRLMLLARRHVNEQRYAVQYVAYRSA